MPGASLPSPPGLLYLQATPCQTAPPAPFGNPCGLQVSAREKGNGEEPFNLFSHLKIQRGSRLANPLQSGVTFWKSLFFITGKGRGKTHVHSWEQGRELGQCKQRNSEIIFPGATLFYVFVSNKAAKGKPKLLFGGTRSKTQQDGSYLAGRVQLDPEKG